MTSEQSAERVIIGPVPVLAPDISLTNLGIMEIDEHTLNCYVEGTQDVLVISIPITQSIDYLKERIARTASESRPGAFLPLTKVHYIMIST